MPIEQKVYWHVEFAAQNIMIKNNRPHLYVWHSNSWRYAQVVDKQTCSVLAAARTRRKQHALLAKQLAARCLAVGIFELNHFTRHVGGNINIVSALRSLGINV
ncbi:50S ribosomal subunit protein L18 [Candidatus Hodgkinia cicadicola]|nr:50S ribosomal subunit protein L18 [Candidatus Hodgkinia cicadicola]